MIPGYFAESYRQDQAIIRTRTQWLITILGLLIVASLPLFLTSFLLSTLNFALVTIVAVLGLHLVTGLCGQISLGHASLVAIGAYITATLVSKFGFSIWACLPIAGIAAGVIGVIFGAPSLRMKGFYLAMSTLAAQFILIWLIQRPFAEYTEGAMGLYCARPKIANINLGEVKNFFYFGLLVVVVSIVVAKNLQRSRIGRAWIAIRDNDLAASMMGISLFKYKLLAFFISCIFAGIAGWLWTIYLGVITPSMFSLKESIWFLGMLVVGGLGSTTGAVMGAVFIRLLDLIPSFIAAQVSVAMPELAGTVLSASASLLFGIVVVAFLILQPRGIYDLWEKLKFSYRMHPYAY